MNFKTTIILILLLVGVGTYVLVTQNNKPAETKPVVKTLLDVKSAEVSALTITNSDGKQISAIKSTDAKGQPAWRLTQPVTAAADTYKVGSLVEEITGIKSKNVVPETGPDAPHTGLDHPQYTIDLTTAGGKTFKLLIGNPLAITDGVYVKAEGQSDVAVVDSSLLTSLDKPAGDLRKTQLFDMASSAVQQLTITHKDGSQLVLEKQPKGWQIVRPVAMPAEQFAIEDLLSTVLNLTPVAFVDDPSQAIGFNSPADIVSLSTAAPTTQPTLQAATMPSAVTVTFGGYEDVEKKNVFVQLPDGSVVKAAASVLDSLNKKPLELRDKSVFDLDPAQVDRLSIATNQPATTQPVAAAVNKLVTLERRKKENRLGPVLSATTKSATSAPATPATAWVLAGDKPVDADDAKITALLAQFHPLKAEKFLEKLPTTQPSKQMTVTLMAIGQSAPTVLALSDPGNDAPLIGSCKGLTFELSRSIATDLSAELKK